MEHIHIEFKIRTSGENGIASFHFRMTFPFIPLPVDQNNPIFSADANIYEINSWTPLGVQGDLRHHSPSPATAAKEHPSRQGPTSDQPVTMVPSSVCYWFNMCSASAAMPGWLCILTIGRRGRVAVQQIVLPRFWMIVRRVFEHGCVARLCVAIWASRREAVW